MRALSRRLLLGASSLYLFDKLTGPAPAWFPHGHSVTSAPVVTPATFNETLPFTNGEVIGTVSATGSPTSFAIVSGNAPGNFAISSAGVVTATANAVTNLTTNGSTTLGVTATNGVGTSPSANVVINYTVSGSLPAGVTLAAIDGETLPTSTTMSNNFYSRNGFTVTANAACNGLTGGWDNPEFFPVGLYLSPVITQSDANRWLDLAITYQQNTPSNTVMSVLRTNLISCVQNFGQDGINTGTGSETVGLLTYDEASTYSQGVSGPIGSCPNANQDGLFWYINNTHTELAFAPSGLSGTPGAGTQHALLTTPVSTPNTTTRTIQVSSIDQYPFSAANDAGLLQQCAGMWAENNSATALTQDQCYRAVLYGSFIDLQRANNNVNQPLITYIENGGPYTQQTAADTYITPPQMNAAAWSVILHGARGYIWFNQTFAGPANGVQDNVNASYFQTVQTSLTNWGVLGGPAQSVSVYQQTKNTDSLVRALAPVINSPWANGYVAVSPAASGLPPSGTFAAAGFDVRAKWYQGGNTNALTNGFYILCMPRYSQTSTNQTATFTLADTAATSAVAIKEACPAAASWTTGNSTITMNNFNPGTVSAGDTVFDLTTGQTIGTVSSWSTASATLTLTGNAAHASSGSADFLAFQKSIAISGGVFTDTFPDGNCVRIYQVNG